MDCRRCGTSCGALAEENIWFYWMQHYELRARWSDVQACEPRQHGALVQEQIGVSSRFLGFVMGLEICHSTHQSHSDFLSYPLRRFRLP